MWGLLFFAFYVAAATIIAMDILAFWPVQLIALIVIYFSYFAIARFFRENPFRQDLDGELMIAITVFVALVVWGIGIVFISKHLFGIEFTEMARQYEGHVKTIAMLVAMMCGFAIGKVEMIGDEPASDV